MKYFIIVTLTIAFIHFTDCAGSNDYGDDADSYGFDKDDEVEDGPKPIYDLNNAVELFKKYIQDFGKKYKDDDDYQTHFKNFVENLKEINRINSDKEYSATVDINLFSDYSERESQSLLGVKS